MMHEPIARRLDCHLCGAPMVLRQTKKFKWRNGQNRIFYSCSEYPRCDGIRASHPSGEPFGRPADPETRSYRIKAHEAFDPLWKDGRLTRKQAYRVLQHIMSMNREEAHISLFTKSDCEALLFRINIGMADNAIHQIGFTVRT
jgi:ssDNA-binding Zn-finger/Zn-ribbon topoisomerase 1